MPDPRRSASSAEGLGQVLDFVRLLWAIEHLLKSASKRMQRRLGITGPQRVVLRIVEQFPGIGAGELADVLHLHPSTLTGVIARLAERKLLVREADPQDARRIRLRPVQRRTWPRGAPTIEAAVSDALAHVSAVQVRHTSAVLNAVIASLETHAAAQNGAPSARPRTTTAGRAHRRVDVSGPRVDAGSKKTRPTNHG